MEDDHFVCLSKLLPPECTLVDRRKTSDLARTVRARAAGKFRQIFGERTSYIDVRTLVLRADVAHATSGHRQPPLRKPRPLGLAEKHKHVDFLRRCPQ